MADSESYLILKTSGKESKYRLFSEDIELLRKALRNKTTSFLDYFSFLIFVFDKQPIQNIPTEWGDIYEWQIIGVRNISKERRFTLSHNTFVKSYLKFRGMKFPEVSPSDMKNEAIFQSVIDKQKKRIGEENYRIIYRRLYEVIGL